MIKIPALLFYLFIISGIFVLAIAQKAEAAKSGIKEIKLGTVYS